MDWASRLLPGFPTLRLDGRWGRPAVGNFKIVVGKFDLACEGRVDIFTFEESFQLRLPLSEPFGIPDDYFLH